MILDEAHKIKDPASQRTKVWGDFFVYGCRHGVGRGVLKALKKNLKKTAIKNIKKL